MRSFLSRYAPWRHLGADEVQLLLILDLGIRWGWVVSLTPRPRFTTRERTPGTHWTGSWVGPRAGLDAKEEKFFAPARNRTPVVQWIVRHHTDWAAPGSLLNFFCVPNISVQAGSGAHTASYPMGTGGPFPGGKVLPGRDADHSHPSSAEVENE
jgi:hypothetical protein